MAVLMFMFPVTEFAEHKAVGRMERTCQLRPYVASWHVFEHGSERPLFDLDPTSQSHEFAFCWCYCGVGLTGNKVKRVHDRASNVLLP
jgi:hypothetical protein